MQAKLLRAIYSERQLDEVMTDFWFNHFNVFINKGATVICSRATSVTPSARTCWGNSKTCWWRPRRARQLLFYLDNWLSVGPNSGNRSRNSHRTRAAMVPLRLNVHRAKAGKPAA